MNFEIIKSIIPNSTYDLDLMIKNFGLDIAQKRMFACFTKVIKILAHNKEGAIIMERKKKEKRVIGFNNVIAKCDKIINKQTKKKKRLEAKINDVLGEPDFIEEPEPVIHNALITEKLSQPELEQLNKLREENLQLVRENQLLSIQVVMRRSLDETMSKCVETKKHDDVTTKETTTLDDLINTGTQTDQSEHDHNIKCHECDEFSTIEREKHFGDKKTALTVMKMLSSHNFMQPNKHETILLVKKAMQMIDSSIKQKFSLFLSKKMVELCDLLLFSFKQMQDLRDNEYNKVIEKLNELK